MLFIVNFMSCVYVRRFSVCAMQSVTSIKFRPTAFTSKAVKYAKACPASHVMGLEVGSITLHIVDPLVQSTRALATLSPLPEVRGRVSVIPARIPDPRGTDTGIRASCHAGIRVLQAVHTTQVRSMVVMRGTLTVPS